MTSTKALVNYIIEGIQDKKGHAIVTADLTQITSAPCQYFIICTGNSPQQVEAIAESIGDSARIKGGEKPSTDSRFISRIPMRSGKCRMGCHRLRNGHGTHFPSRKTRILRSGAPLG